MGSFYTPYSAYSNCEYLDNLSVYGLNAGVDQLLDLSRQIEESQDYYWQNITFPSTPDADILPLQTYSGVVTLPSLAFLINMTGSAIIAADTTGGGTIGAYAPYGFKLRIYDKGGKIDTFINSQFARKQGVCPNLVTETDSGTPPTFGPYFLQSPMVVLQPGALQLEITNLDPLNNVVCQLSLSLAIPVNLQSANELLVGEHN